MDHLRARRNDGERVESYGTIRITSVLYSSLAFPAICFATISLYTSCFILADSFACGQVKTRIVHSCIFRTVKIQFKIVKSRFLRHLAKLSPEYFL